MAEIHRYVIKSPSEFAGEPHREWIVEAFSAADALVQWQVDTRNRHRPDSIEPLREGGSGNE